MMPYRTIFLFGLFAALLHVTASNGADAITIVTLGDSITKGVRPGVEADQTFSAYLEQSLNEAGVDARVINLGIGGERTDQALARFDAVAAANPDYVTIMYGTNDSFIDEGKSSSRLGVDAYRLNLEELAARLLLLGSEPILMTAPRWAAGGRTNGLGEDPNIRLGSYMEAAREVARRNLIPLVDHHAEWQAAQEVGRNLADWMTDGLHPNPAGHELMAEAMLPVVLAAVRSDVALMTYRIELETPMIHDGDDFLWFHPRATAMPGLGEGGAPAVLMTLQKHLRVSDYYSGLYAMRRRDPAGVWTDPDGRPELDWVREGDVNIAVADVTPGWHPETRTALAVGAQVRYSAAGRQLEDQPRSHQTAYAVFSPDAATWTRWRRLEMPAGEEFNFARSACAQFVVEADGSVLLPFYISTSARDLFRTTVARFSFDGMNLGYIEHGNVMSLDVARGLYEPSLIRFGDRFYLTIRNDEKAYVTVGRDGLNFRPVKPWLFDDGGELGSYNTQQHWLAHGGALFLVYTRRGVDNDHIMRHRAPLFMAQVDPDRLVVLRATERVVVPERGATLGNFGAAAIDENESWITVAEGSVWNDEARARGAEGAVFVARVIWGEPAAGE